MSWPHIVGISGPARSGKDTAAAWFLDHGYKRYSFATPLKCGLRAMLGLTVDHTDGNLKESIVEPYGVSTRCMMQTIGTEWGREMVNDRIWLLRAEQVIAEWRADDPDLRGVVISDVRFENEATWVREQGGLVIHLRRPDAAQVAAHASEAGIASHPDDSQALNDGTIAELYEKLDGIMRAHVGGEKAEAANGSRECRVPR